LLVTVLVVHLIHRPYWRYYYLHFAVPIAWLTGYGVAGFCKAAWRGPGTEGEWQGAKSEGRPTGNARQDSSFEDQSAGSQVADAGGEARGSRFTCHIRSFTFHLSRFGWGAWRRRLAGGAVVLAAAVLVSVVECYGGLRLYDEITDIRALPRVEGNPIVAAMRKYAGRTHWVYTKATMYPFDAGLPVIPELAVLPMKRYWSGQITQKQILAALERYKPEQILLSAYGATEQQAPRFLSGGYRVVCENSGLRLYVVKPLLGGASAARRGRPRTGAGAPAGSGRRRTAIELSKGASPIVLLLLLPQSNLESKIKSMIKSKRQGISPKFNGSGAPPPGPG
jgi:hypothetical protein